METPQYVHKCSMLCGWPRVRVFRDGTQSHRRLSHCLLFLIVVLRISSVWCCAMLNTFTNTPAQHPDGSNSSSRSIWIMWEMNINSDFFHFPQPAKRYGHQYGGFWFQHTRQHVCAVPFSMHTHETFSFVLRYQSRFVLTIWLSVVRWLARYISLGQI